MKKYQQLLLAIISIISFSCLLIYRHEYNKLRYVLEVLNFFGTPNASASTPLLCQNNENVNRVTLTSFEPLPAWQRISNSLYIYSAYWEKVENKEHVVALAVGILNENLNYGCYLYYSTTPRTKPGQFSFSGIPFKTPDGMSNKNSKSRTKGFMFYCETEAKGDPPVGVIFYKTSVNESTQGYLPVIHLQSTLPAASSTGICIMPAPFTNYNRSTYLEFLSFHKILGVNNFIAYGGNDQYSLLSSINQDSSFKINITILPWNYPFYSDYGLIKLIAENDCKIRTSGVFENVLILEWNKFFVPRHVFGISKILNEFDVSKKVYKFQFLTMLFCKEYPDNMKANSSTPYVFRKTRFAYPKSDILVPIYRPHLRMGHIQKISKDIVVIQQYVSCRDFRIKSGEKKVAKIDTSIFKFQDELLNSKLLKL